MIQKNNRFKIIWTFDSANNLCGNISADLVLPSINENVSYNFRYFRRFSVAWGTLLTGLPPGPPASWEVPHSWGCISRMVQRKVVWIKDSKKYKHSLAEKPGFVVETAPSRSGYLWRSSSPWGRGYGQDLAVQIRCNWSRNHSEPQIYFGWNAYVGVQVFKYVLGWLEF